MKRPTESGAREWDDDLRWIVGLDDARMTLKAVMIPKSVFLYSSKSGL